MKAMKKFLKMPVMKKSWKKPVIIICVAAVVLTGGYFGYKFITKPASKTAQTYMKLKATKGTIEVAVSASGTAGSSISKDVLAQTNVTLGSFSVKAGDVVKSGQSIGNLVDANSDQNVQKAKNVLAQDNLKLAQLKKSLNSLYVKAPVSGIVQSVNAVVGDDAATNAKNLHSVIIAYTSSDGKQQLVNVDAQSGTISSVFAVVGATVNKGDNLFQLSPEDINNSITSQNLNISQDETALSNAQKQADYNNLLSPVNGTVAALNFNPGDNIQSGKVVATIIDLTQMQTVVAVDELDIDKVKVGQKAVVTVDAITGKTFVGQVAKISSIGKTTNSVTTYDVTVSIDAADGVKTGMTTNVKISVQIKENVVMLPIEAVQGTGNNKSVTVENSGSSSNTSSANSGSTAGSAVGNTTGNSSGSGVQRSKNGGGVTTAIATSGVTRKRIQVGIANQNFVEVTSGVNEGDTVLVAIVKSSTTSTTKTTNPLGGAGGFGGGGGGYTGGNGGGRSGN
jgi:HlyD family secretion protein